MKKHWWLVLALAVVIGAVAVILSLPKRLPKLEPAFMLGEGKQAPEWSLKGLDGESVTLSQFNGNKGVVLAFFATWCPICMEEVPQLKSFQASYDKRNIAFLAVNVAQPAHAVEQFIKDRGVNYKVLLDEDGSVSAKYGVEVTGIPLIVGIDAGGTVRYMKNGLPGDLDAFVSSLEPAVAAADTTRSP